MGNVDATNYFIENGKSVNKEGKELRAEDFQSLTLPQPLERNADGSFETGNFLTKD